MSRAVEMVGGHKALLGEGPSWDRANRLLYWVDISGNKVHLYEPETGEDRQISMPGFVSSIVSRRSGGCVVTLQHGFYTLDLESSRLSLLAEVETGLNHNRFNDGKCDVTGRFWAGTMNMNKDSPSGALYSLLEDHTVRKQLSNVKISNGLGWSPDNKTMFYIDTPTLKVSGFDYDSKRGTISNRRTVVDFSTQKGRPDGMAVDEEGMIWVAHWGGSMVSRWNPSTGKLLERLALPVSQVTSCCFAGEKLDELYITTAGEGLDPEVLSKEPHSGTLFRARVGVRGLPTFEFAG